MKTFVIISRDFFRVNLTTYLVLVFLELINTGMVQRFLNLEIYLYFLMILYIFNRVIDR
ncbi:MAG: hypothetical protein HOE19_02325 [Candidatus Komeilibacteria bacterium]|jgi:hypothetical protein|nr:hypothetical protein [Candidatus Komeilibacteria bacterium]MBT4448058.1 hypothetical protein [Candidatus Komeilibacteria bacterium]